MTTTPTHSLTTSEKHNLQRDADAPADGNNHAIRVPTRATALDRDTCPPSLLFGRLWGARNFCRQINFAEARLIRRDADHVRPDADKNEAGVFMVKTPAGKVEFESLRN